MWQVQFLGNNYLPAKWKKDEPFAKFGSALGQPWVSPWERGRPARILVKALPRRQSAGEPTNPVKPIATTLPSLVRAGRPRSQESQPFPAINPTYWRILQKARMTLEFEVSRTPAPYFICKPPRGPNFLVTVQPLEQAGRLGLSVPALFPAAHPPVPAARHPQRVHRSHSIARKKEFAGRGI